MKSHSPNLRTVAAILCGVGLVVGALAPRARADQWDKRTILTVNQPIQVRDQLLQPGQYVLRLLDSNSNRHIVQIFNGDQTRLVETVLAVPNYRLQPTGDSQFMFWETPPGNAKALRAWFYPGDNFGQEFPYPKHFYQLEANAVTTTMASAAPAYEPAPAPAETETQPAQPMTEEAQPAQPEPQPAQPEAEQPAPAPTTAAPEQAPPPPAEPAPQQLPKTGSWYPMLGILGVTFLGLFGILRLSRSS